MDDDFSRYLNNSETSLEEVVACLDLILEDGHITKGEFDEYLNEAVKLGSQLIGFGRKVRQQGKRL
jgi:four helix bundle protein